MVSTRTLASASGAVTESQAPTARPDLQDLDLLTPDDVCSLLKVKKSWLYDEVEAGRLDALRLGKQLRFRPSDLARYLRECSKAPNGTPPR
jgi:excisionase family DNA binding protein